jgi:hypothetical protein
MIKANPVESRLRMAGMILILGLFIEGFCLLSHGAVGFIIFAGLGGSLLLLGVVVYLLALVRSNESEK